MESNFQSAKHDRPNDLYNLSLDGLWRLRQHKDRSAVSAHVPGCVHLDLLRAGKIPDPFFRDQEKAVKWIEHEDWVYDRSFVVAPELIARRRILLRCEGLDTLAEVSLNRRKLCDTDNMFRIYEWDVTNLLKAGRNTIAIRFRSTLRHGTPLYQRNRLIVSSEAGPEYRVRAFFRKEQCNYGWDWGPALVTCGIWRPICLLGFDVARLVGVRLQQDHSRRGEVSVQVTAGVERAITKGPLVAVASLDYLGKTVAEERVPVPRGGRVRLNLRVRQPKLWWPHGLGEQPLYQLRVRLLDRDGRVVDEQTRRVGLRTLRLIREADKDGETFCFAANGVRFFAKGANWIPADTFAPSVTPERTRDLLCSARDAHMNMLRVWGGGIYESDVFYDLCDELGICVWQDFMFACAAYPLNDRDFIDNVRREAEDQVGRLGHHACLALWCGNNELEGGKANSQARWEDGRMPYADYGRLFDKLLPKVVRSLAPETDYWPSSPHSPQGKRDDRENPRWGDAHLYRVQLQGLPFENFRTYQTRFMSEFGGFTCLPHPRTVATFTQPEDRELNHPILAGHEKCKRSTGRTFAYVLDWFRMPRDFDSANWLGQILCGFSLEYSIEHLRRQMPRTMGALYWMLNDTWPCSSFSTVDYFGRWKAPHYYIKRAFAPVAVSGVEDLKRELVELHAVNDLTRAVESQLVWTVLNVTGRVLGRGKQKVRLASQSHAHLMDLNMRPFLARYAPNDLLVFFSLLSDGSQALSRNLAFFQPPRLMPLVDPRLMATVRAAAPGAFEITVRSRAPALHVWLDVDGLDARFSDNFFHLPPGQPIRIGVVPQSPTSIETLRRRLRLRSLFDTYRSAR